MAILPQDWALPRSSPAEAGTAEPANGIRIWKRNLSELIHAFDFIHARPATAFIARKPGPLAAATLAVGGGNSVGLELLPFQHDLVIRAQGVR